MRFSIVLSAIALAAMTTTAVSATLSTQPKKQPAPVVTQQGPSSGQQRKPFDCHRDVREHRINGVRLSHRHVGANCEIRLVNRVN